MASIERGTRIGAFEIQESLGAGGQGEVYKARDIRLDRTVAIKILPKQIANDPERKQRFEREAQTIAKLNHAHICILHDVGHDGGIDYLVMEYVDGETLAQRLSRGPLPLNQAVELAMQIGDALDKAHRRGVVHRDVKPSNIMIAKSGAKLMDFGLAKQREPATGFVSPSDLSTVANITGQGTILGTLQYMAPEQLEGKDADARSDVWGFGSVLYEMLTGKKAFEGKSQTSLMVAILEHEPAPVRTSQPLTPPSLEHILKRCLAKDPDRRWQTFSDIVIELESLSDRGSSAAGPATSDLNAIRRRARYMFAACAALGISLAGLIAFGLLFMRPEPDLGVTRFNIQPPEGMIFSGNMVISPDGRKLAFFATTAGDQRKLWVQPLDSSAPQVLPGTEGASNLFWSPDSRQIAFSTSVGLKKVNVAGGAPQSISEGLVSGPGAWSADGTILFTRGTGPLVRVSSAGGTPVPVTTLDSQTERTHVSPRFLPDGRHFLYRAIDPAPRSVSGSTLFVGAVDSKERTRIGNFPASVAYAAGYLLFVRNDALMAQRFDPKKLQVNGEPLQLVDGVSGFSVSNDGVLTYRKEPMAGTPAFQLTWFDRQGKQTALKDLPPANYTGLALSSDGKRLAIVRLDRPSNNGDIWLHDLVRGITSRFTFDPASDISPQWSPGETHIVFIRSFDAPSFSTSLFRKNATGAGDEELLAKLGEFAQVTDWSSDGRLILYQHATLQKFSGDLSILPLDRDKKPQPFLQTEFDEKEGRFSPNVKWVAYSSNPSGRLEIYVRPVSPSTAQWQISRDGGLQPRWRRDGKELFYLAPDGKMMAVPIQETSNAIEAGLAKPLFDTKLKPSTQAGLGPRSDYAVTPDGQRFLIIVPASAQNAADPADPIHVILNWPALLKN
jgi:eukaryotic-like serine/threonine-protein kinase